MRTRGDLFVTIFLYITYVPGWQQQIRPLIGTFHTGITSLLGPSYGLVTILIDLGDWFTGIVTTAQKA